ncbi:acyl dehydratase [Candidatus Poriferisocius sp.]|uniref:acyl dehydratase n=1 Tax=Candidatus Poriferisocius sp. TaxID=3101276 RepID=UPI003B5B9C38
MGEQLDPAPAITIGPGEAAVYQAICGDPLAVSLSRPLAEAVTGRPGAVVNPALVMQMAIGQSTVATRKVVANLFYRGVRLLRTVRVGETLTTTVTVKGLREASARPDRPPRGLVLLAMRTVDTDGGLVLDFERCALVRQRSDAPTGRHDDLGGSPEQLDFSPFAEVAPTHWDLTPLGPPQEWPVGETRRDPLRDTVTDAPALVRLTQNLAPPHRDATLGQGGRRLVYGGHTVGLAQAGLVRLFPGAATVVGWHLCDHTGPVFEGDVLEVAATVDAEHRVANGRLLAFTVVVTAERDGHDPVPVLDWRPIVLAR